MKKILPFKIDTVFTSYPHFGFMTSMIETKDNGLKWIYQTYTQICGHRYEGAHQKERDFKLSFFPTAGMGKPDLWDISPYIDTFTIDRKELLAADDHVAFIKDLINKDYYCLMYIDQFFREDVGKVGVFYHPMMIYGYDDDKQVFYCADCFEGFVYASKEVTYEQFKIGSHQNYNTDDSTYGLHLYKLKDHIVPTFSFVPFKWQLKDYAESRKPMDYTFMTQYPNGRWQYEADGSYGEMFFGIDAYKELKKIIEDVVYNKYQWNLKFMLTPDFRFITDRAKLSLDRYKYLYMNYRKNCPYSENILQRLESQYEAAKVMENVLLKYVRLLDRDSERAKKQLPILLDKLQEFIDEEYVVANMLEEIINVKFV